jgi:hypothetical protein
MCTCIDNIHLFKVNVLKIVRKCSQVKRRKYGKMYLYRIHVKKFTSEF